MKKTLLSIVSICIITLSANAVNTYNQELSSDGSGNTKISIAYDATAKMWQAGQKGDLVNVYPEFGTRIGFNIEGTTNCTSGNGFIYIATYDNTSTSWNIISDTIKFALTDTTFSKLGYVTLKENLTQGTIGDSLYVIFAGETSKIAQNTTLDFQFSRYKTSYASPYNILVLPFPDITIKYGELAPRIKLTDYFICPSNTTHLEFTQTDEMPSDSGDYYIVKGIIMGEYLGFNVYGIGSAEVYINATAINSDVTNEYSYGEGYVMVTVIENDEMPTDCNLEIIPDITLPSCFEKNDGSIELSVSGGIEPYSYRWNNQRTTKNLYNIEEGIYTVTICDSVGCIATKSVYLYSNSNAYISQSIAPTCGQADGTLEVICDDTTATYLWNTGATESTLTNIPAGYYSVTITNKNGCTQNLTTYVNNSYTFYTYADYYTSTLDIDCNATNGSIHTIVGGGTEPYTYKWENLNITTNYATNLGIGTYIYTVTDANGCVAGSTQDIRSNSLYAYRGPDISSVTISEETNNMLVFWQKPETDYIDFYTIYRERNDAPGLYDTLGTIPYGNLSVYADEEVDPNLNSWRYKLSATDMCGNESKMSYGEYKSIHLNFSVANDNIITLQWDPYEGMYFDRYAIFKITKDGNVKVAEVSQNCTRYSEKIEDGTLGYVIGVDFLDTIDVTLLLKAESGPFSLAMSNIAELENVSAKQVSISPNANVSVKQNIIIVDNPNKSNIAVYDILGHSIAKNTSRANYVTFPMTQKGIYIVIVGNEAFKVMVQ